MPIVTHQYLIVAYILYVLGWEIGGAMPPQLWSWGQMPPSPPAPPVLPPILGAVFSPGFKCQRARFNLTSFGLSITAPLLTLFSSLPKGTFDFQALAKGQMSGSEGHCTLQKIPTENTDWVRFKKNHEQLKL